MPGGRLVVSSNGTTGVVWGTCPVLGDANSKVVPGALVAYDATPAANGFDAYRVGAIENSMETDPSRADA